MAIDIAYKFLKIAVIRGASKRKVDAQVRSTRNKTVGVVEAVPFNYFNRIIVGPK